MLAADAALPRLWTGEAVLDRALEIAGFREDDLRAAMTVTRESLGAVVPEKVKRTTDAEGQVKEEIQGGGAPDWDARHRGAEQIYSFLGFRAARKLAEGDGAVPVTAVSITLNMPKGGTTGRGAERQPAARRYRYVRLAPPATGADNGHGV